VVRGNLGRLAGRAGDTVTARHLLEEALAGFEAIDATGFVLETRLRLLELDAPDHLAVASIERLLLDGEQAGAGATVEAPGRRLLGTAYRVAGADDRARSELERAVTAARADSLGAELVASLDELGALGDHAAATEAATTRLALGIT
ncbi:MAG: hypothetical protein AAGG08_02875, partial [Actinomycetota bacterium]